MQTVEPLKGKINCKTDMEFCASALSYLADDLSQIVEEYVEFMKLKAWKPTS